MTPYNWNFPYSWPRKPVLAANVVATTQPLAAQAGLRMMLAGGNAVDAILAVHAGFLLAGGLLPVPPGLEAIAAAKRRLGRGAVEWLERRRDRY